MKTLTITIPSYNVEQYLEKTMETLLQPAIIDDIEILVVNDGSTDKTREVAERYQERYPNSVFVINKENGGHGSTINTGIKKAHGKYFRVIDGDDWVEPEAFVSYVQKLKNLDVDLVLTPFRHIYIDTGNTRLKAFDRIKPGHVYHVDDILKDLGINYSIHSATYSTDIVRRIPTISEHCFYVDIEYICYTLPLIDTVVILDDIVYQYRCGNPEQSVSRKKMIANRNMHRQVTNNIVRFYHESAATEAKKNWLKLRCATLIRNQLNIYLSMPISAATKKELLVFSNEVKKQDPELYRTVEGKAIQLLKLSNNRLYSAAAMLWRIKNT